MTELFFSFGDNWNNFIKNYFNNERLDEAKKSLISFCKGKNLIRGKTFADVGCGSGLFSLAAYKLGASKIFSFDIDQKSIKCCQYLKNKTGNPSNWHIEKASILDDDFINSSPTYDFVYSWGVLHHTGQMWKAIKNTARLVNKGGLLYLAIYNKSDNWGFYPDGRFGPSSFWQKEKKLYASLPVLIQTIIDYLVMTLMIFVYILTFKNPFKQIKKHNKLRGMSWRIDIKDWLGGFPYEYASITEIFNYLDNLGFSLINIKSNSGLLNNEFLFRKH